MSMGTDQAEGLGILAKLSIALDGLSGKVDSWRKEDERRRKLWRPMTPVDYHPIGSGIIGAAGAPSSTTAVIPLNAGTAGPDEGHVWIVRRWCVYAQSGVTGTLGGRADLFAIGSQQVSSLSPLQGPGWAATAASLPTVQYFSSRQVVLRNGEYLVCVITGGTQNQAAFTEAQVEDYEEAPRRTAFEL